jgi:hypothetical protein
VTTKLKRFEIFGAFFYEYFTDRLGNCPSKSSTKNPKLVKVSEDFTNLFCPIPIGKVCKKKNPEALSYRVLFTIG